MIGSFLRAFDSGRMSSGSTDRMSGRSLNGDETGKTRCFAHCTYSPDETSYRSWVDEYAKQWVQEHRRSKGILASFRQEVKMLHKQKELQELPCRQHVVPGQRTT
jgi:hypothetical protein